MISFSEKTTSLRALLSKNKIAFFCTFAQSVFCRLHTLGPFFFSRFSCSKSNQSNVFSLFMCSDASRYTASKGHIKPKAVWARRRISQKMKERICFVCREKQTNQIPFFIFLENLQHANLLSVLSDLQQHGLKLQDLELHSLELDNLELNGFELQIGTKHFLRYTDLYSDTVMILFLMILYSFHQKKRGS